MTVGERIENVVGKNGIRLSGTDCMVLAFTREEWFKEWNQEKFMQEAPSCPMCERPLGHDYEIIKKHEEQKPTTKNDLGVDAVSRQAVLNIAKASKSNWIDNSILFKRVTELPSVTPQEPKWIPVSEGLPKESNTYEVTLQGVGELEGIDNEVAYATWLDNREVWLYHDVDDWKYKEVIAWKPMSKPYKAESEGK